MKKESLIGKKVKGFKFEDSEYPKIGYTIVMDKQIGEEGEIIQYIKYTDSYNIRFNEADWEYPAKLVIKNLISNHPLIITKQTKVRAGKKYYTWQMSKNKKVVNHQYNQPGTRNKQLNTFLDDIKNGNYIIK